jgi:phosphinothricin acetyltransferase
MNQLHGIQVRPASIDDLPGVLDIYNDAVLTTTATYDVEPRTLEHRRRWFEEHQLQNLPVLVASDEAGRIAGWSALNRHHERFGYRFTVENSVYVAAPFRGRGVGRSLLEPLIEAAQRLGLHAILAGIDAENAASIRLHTAFGFEKVAHFRQVGHKFGRWLDVVYYQRMLD